MADNIIVKRQDGTTYDLSKEGIKVISFDISSPAYNHSWSSLGKYYTALSTTTVAQRQLTLTFDVKARDNADYELQWLKVMRIFDSTEWFYVINQRLPWLRWKVVAETFTYPRKENFWMAKAVAITLDAIDGYGETIAKTSDPFKFDVGTWGIGMGIPFDRQKYSFSNQNDFDVFNPSSIPLLANERPIVIKFNGNAPSGLTLMNNSTGQTFKYNQPLSVNDTLQLIGIVPIVNGQQKMGSGYSNREFLDFKRGDNNITVSGASDFTISFETRFYY